MYAEKEVLLKLPKKGVPSRSLSLIKESYFFCLTCLDLSVGDFTFQGLNPIMQEHQFEVMMTTLDF